MTPADNKTIDELREAYKGLGWLQWFFPKRLYKRVERKKNLGVVSRLHLALLAGRFSRSHLILFPGLVINMLPMRRRVWRGR